MLYVDDKFSYSLEECINKHSEEWKKIFFNVLTVKIALLSKTEKRIKLKEVDIEGITLDVVNESISVFDKFLINIKGYKKFPMIDEYNGEDITLHQDINYNVILSPFRDFFDRIEVR